jgi:transcriptional regulator with XRE-family HTH domain
VLRAARRQAGMSQRTLAAQAGLSHKVIGEIESGVRDPRWSLVNRLLEVLERGIALGLVEAEPDEALVHWLHLSTSDRLYLSLGGRTRAIRDLAVPVWRALDALAAGRVVVLSPEASASVWLPNRPVQLPVQATVVLESPPVRPLTACADLLTVSHGPLRLGGLVHVGVGPRWEVLAHPPDSPLMATAPELSAQLRCAAALLDREQRRNASGGRPAAHKDPRVLWEGAFVMTRRGFGRFPTPDIRDRRDWRLGGEPSFRDWRARRGFPDARPPGGPDEQEPEEEPLEGF